MPKPKECIPWIDSVICIPKRFLRKHGVAEDEFREFLDARLSVKNPAWIQKARFAKWQGWRKDTPEYLRFYKETDGAFRVPRNMDLPDWFPADKALDKTFVGVTTRYKCSMVLRAYQQ